MIFRIALAGVALTGCSGSFSRVMDGVSDVPTWFDASRQEIRGVGYPSLRTVPTIEPDSVIDDGLELTEAESNAAKAAFLSDPRSETSTMGPDEIRSEAELMARPLLRGPGRAEFLTDAEIAQVKRMFARRRPPKPRPASTGQDG